LLRFLNGHLKKQKSSPQSFEMSSQLCLVTRTINVEFDNPVPRSDTLPPSVIRVIADSNIGDFRRFVSSCTRYLEHWSKKVYPVLVLAYRRAAGLLPLTLAASNQAEYVSVYLFRMDGRIFHWISSTFGRWRSYTPRMVICHFDI